MGKYIDWALVEIERLGASLPEDVRREAIAEAESHLLATAARHAEMTPDEAQRQAIREFGPVDTYVSGLKEVHLPRRPAKADPWTIAIASLGAMFLSSWLVRGDFRPETAAWILSGSTALLILFLVTSVRAKRWQIVPLAAVGAIATTCFLLGLALNYSGPVGSFNRGGPKGQIALLRDDAQRRARDADWRVDRLRAWKMEFDAYASKIDAKQVAGFPDVFRRHNQFLTFDLRDGDAETWPAEWSDKLVDEQYRAEAFWRNKAAGLILRMHSVADDERLMAARYDAALEAPFTVRLRTWCLTAVFGGVMFTICALVLNGLGAAIGRLASRRHRRPVALG